MNDSADSTVRTCKSSSGQGAPETGLWRFFNFYYFTCPV